MQSRAIFASDHFPSVHAATIAPCPLGGLMAAWFAGAHEGAPDVAIYTSRYANARWQAPILTLRTPGVPCWNPVLFARRNGDLWLYAKAGPTIPAWTATVSQWEPPMDEVSQPGAWSPPHMLPAGLLGPAKNKPIELADGTILCGSSRESWRSWACWVERSTDGGATWSLHGPINAPQSCPTSDDNQRESISATWSEAKGTLELPQQHAGVIQPTMWEVEAGHVIMLMRATQRVGYICRSESHDGGRTWSATRATNVPCPNSGLDAAQLSDGRVVLACNPVHQGRTPLSLLVSADQGCTWRRALTLEDNPGEYSYPSVIVSPTGSANQDQIHVVYTWQRKRIQHVMLTPDELE